VAKAQADAIASRVSAAVGGLSAQEQSIGAQMQAGLLGQEEGERRLQELRQRTLEQLREYRDAAQRALESMAPGTPEYQQAVEGLAGIDTHIANVTASMRKLQMQAQDQAVNALTGFFSDLATGAKNFKEAFRDMVSSFVQGIARMAAELMARKIVMSIFGKLGLSVSPATANAKGNVFDTAGIRAFARGAVFPTIAAFAAGGAFTNQVVASPTLFAFGKGGQLGVMGEAGPEAIMPLTRGPDGRLGVVAHGAGRDVTVIVENHSGAQARVEEGTAGDGSRLVKVIVDAAVGEVNRQIAGMGSTGRAISSRFGLSPAGVTRG
jgi:lambda family phage tail tape measure protein